MADANFSARVGMQNNLMSDRSAEPSKIPITAPGVIEDLIKTSVHNMEVRINKRLLNIAGNTE